MREPSGAPRHSLFAGTIAVFCGVGGTASPKERDTEEAAHMWTCKSVRKLAEELGQMGHAVSYPVVAELLHELDYSLQANRKTKEGEEDHPDRDAQFEHIDAKVKQYIGRQQPVISVDTKKKELVGDFKNGGQSWKPKGKPEKVRVHDFVIPELGRAALYGAMIWRRTADGSAWEWTRIRHPSRWPPSGAGGTRWDRRNTRKPNSY